MSVEIDNGPRIYSLKEDGEKYFYINTKKSNFKVKEFACKDGSDKSKLMMSLLRNYKLCVLILVQLLSLIAAIALMLTILKWVEVKILSMS